MTNLELLQSCTRGIEVEYFMYLMGSGCKQLSLSRNGKQEESDKIWRQVCQRERCCDHRLEFWRSETDISPDIITKIKSMEVDEILPILNSKRGY